MSYAFIDVETSGLRPDENAVLQLGCLVTNDKFEVTEEFETLVNPPEGLIITPEAMNINKIDLEECKKAPSEKDALILLNKFLNKHNTPVLVGYNVNFDMSFLKSVAYRSKLHLHSDGFIIDLHLTVRNVEGIMKYSLKSVCEHFGIRTDGHHNALRDCYLAMEVAKRVL